MALELRRWKHGLPYDIRGPLAVTIRAFWICPKSQERKREPRPAMYRAKRPDADNVAKATLDAGNGVLWLDDDQVVRLTVEKWQAAQGEPPRVEIEVRRIEEE